MIPAWVANIFDGLFNGCLTSQPAHAEIIISKCAFLLLIAVVVAMLTAGRHIAIGIVNDNGFIAIVICSALIPATRDTGVVGRVNRQRLAAADIALKPIFASGHSSHLLLTIWWLLQPRYMKPHAKKERHYV